MRTERLTLDPVTMADLAEFVALDRVLRPDADPTRSAGYLAAFVETWRTGDLGYWTIRLRREVIGFGGVQPKKRSGPPAWNLYYRLHPDHRGHGYATEMAWAAVAAARETRPEWPVLIETRPDNAPSIALAGRLGMTREPDHEGYAVFVLPAIA
ncbi:hypothetical protein GCM10022243_13920 [Saccharothrix violaceirubra]|uniref:RimJ/RimL family protein N-acetyltransferase n=1 Tax=Saccharothrix violaceirubra TaxID=413306 RepID=A0A7W7T641_9PSEU|nr:GNAT family N-acetyltransferase [Saccharothrix violaceirubra]MBB4967266.1 RimJ/RimL family protein N-acetyltransferase [Saccharothrix violaceirubra]